MTAAGLSLLAVRGGRLKRTEGIARLNSLFTSRSSDKLGICHYPDILEINGYLNKTTNIKTENDFGTDPE